MHQLDHIIYAICLFCAALALLSMCVWKPALPCTGSTIVTAEGVQCLD